MSQKRYQFLKVKEVAQLLQCFLWPGEEGANADGLASVDGEPDVFSVMSELMNLLNEFEAKASIPATSVTTAKGSSSAAKGSPPGLLTLLPLPAQFVKYVICHIMLNIDGGDECSNISDEFDDELLSVLPRSYKTSPLAKDVVAEREVLLGLFSYTGYKFAPLVVEIQQILLERLACKQPFKLQQPAEAVAASGGSGPSASLPRWTKSIEQVLTWCDQILASKLQQRDGAVQFVEQDLDALTGETEEEKQRRKEKEEAGAGSSGDEDDEDRVNDSRSGIATPDEVGKRWFALVTSSLIKLLTFLKETLTSYADVLLENFPASTNHSSMSCIPTVTKELQTLLIRVSSLATNILSGTVVALQFHGSVLKQLVDLLRGSRGGNKANAREVRQSRAEGESFRYSVPVFIPSNEENNGWGVNSLVAEFSKLIIQALNSALHLDCHVFTGEAGPVAKTRMFGVNIFLWLLSRRKHEDALHRLIVGGSAGQDFATQQQNDDVEDSAMAGAFMTQDQRLEFRLRREKKRKAIKEAVELWSDEEELEYDEETGQPISAASNDYELQRLLASEVVAFSPIGILVLFSGYLKQHEDQIARGRDPIIGTNFLPLEVIFDELLPAVRFALKHDALAAKEHALCFIYTMSTLLPKYSIHLSEEELEDGAIGDKGDGGTTDDRKLEADDEHSGKSSNRDANGRKETKIRCITRKYQDLFFLAQDIVNIMATCSSIDHRTFGAEILRCFLNIFSEKTRLPMLRGLVELSPYSSVTTLLLLHLKDEVLLEYQLLKDRVEKELVGISDGGVASALNNSLSRFRSEVLSRTSVDFVCGALNSWSGKLKVHGEPMVTGSNVLRTMLFSDVSFKRFCEEKLKGASCSGGESSLPSGGGLTHGYLFGSLNENGKLMKDSATTEAKKFKSKKSEQQEDTADGRSGALPSSSSGAVYFGGTGSTLKSRALNSEAVVSLLTDTLSQAELEKNLQKAQDAKTKTTLGGGSSDASTTTTGGEGDSGTRSFVDPSSLAAGEFTFMMRFSIEMAVDGLRGCVA